MEATYRGLIEQLDTYSRVRNSCMESIRNVVNNLYTLSTNQQKLIDSHEKQINFLKKKIEDSLNVYSMQKKTIQKGEVITVCDEETTSPQGMIFMIVYHI